MSELMERYEAERGGIMPCGMEIPGGFIYSKEYVAWLEAQLTWRPVDYPPKVDGEYLCRWEGPGRFIALYKNKTWLVWDDELEEHVELKYLPYMYLPIPPAPKGE